MKKEFTWDVAWRKWFNHPKSVELVDNCVQTNMNTVYEAMIQFYLIKEKSKKMAQCEKLKAWLEDNWYRTGNIRVVSYVGSFEAIDEIFRN